jgi:pyroglutamyl-peptidase
MRMPCNDRAVGVATESNQEPPLRVLLTGFEPFDQATRNPSADAIRLVAARGVPGIALSGLVLPTSFAGADAALTRALLEAAPAFDVVLSVGLAGGRAGLTVERVAINLDDARIPDNDGAQPVDARVEETGPAAYFATLPVKAMVAAIRAAGIEAAVSYSAGTFVCNHLLYRALHLAATRYPGLRCGFVHVPWLPEQVPGRVPEQVPEQVAKQAAGGVASLEAVAKGLAAALRCLRDGVEEPMVAEGTLS